MNESFDVVILGAGSGGERLATLLADAGRSVAICETDLVGGECPFYACMPSKAMLWAVDLRGMIRQAGAVGAADRTIDPGDGKAALPRALAWRDKIAEHLDDSDHAKELTDAGITLIRGRGQVLPGGVVEVAGRRLEWTDLVIATGAAAQTPPIDGLDRVATWTSDELWTAAELPDNVIILGGGAVGCEAAQVLARFGLDVVLIEPKPTLLPAETAAVGTRLAQVLRDDGVDVRTGVTPKSAEPSGEPAGDGARLVLDDDTTVTAQRVIVATGRSPRSDGLGLEVLDIADFCVDDHLRVGGHDHVWAIGDVTGLAPFTHTANYHARVVAANLTGRNLAADHTAIPRGVYTTPAVASVGLTAQQASDRWLRVVTAEFDLGDTSRDYVTTGPGGGIWLVADADRGVLVGAAIVAAGAAEMIGELAVAIRGAVPLAVLADVVHPFPTYSEGLGLAFRELFSAV